MKKYFSFAIVFVLLTTFSAIALAGGGMVGQVIDSEYPLWLHGNKVSKNVIAINGVSYVPVRVLGEAMGLDVEFKDNQVFLKSKSKPELYYYKSNWFDISKTEYGKSDQAWFFELDGAQYIPFEIFRKYYSYEDQIQDGVPVVVGKISLPGKPEYNLPVVKGNEEYVKGCKIFVKMGRTFIKASEPGVTAVIKGNEVWIEK